MASYSKRNNKWSVIFDMPTADGTRLQKRLSGYSSRREAELAYIAFKGENKVVVPQSDDLFKDIYAKYMKQKEGTVKESTILTMDDAFRLHILPYFANYPLSKIKHTDILDWQEWLQVPDKRGRKLSVTSINKYHTYLGNFLSFCIDFDYISQSPLQKIKKLKNQDRKEEMIVWTENHYKAFMEQITDPVYAALYATLYLTGLRIGEALALTWGDLKDNELNINKGLTRRTKNETPNGKKRITSTKNKSSDRIVLIPSTLKIRLAALKEGYKKEQNFSESNFIFGNHKPLPHESIKRIKDSACVSAKVPVIRIHDFRHSHASYLISKGFDIVTIAKRLGHSNIEMTLNRYAHLMPTRQEELVAALEI